MCKHSRHRGELRSHRDRSSLAARESRRSASDFALVGSEAWNRTKIRRLTAASTTVVLLRNSWRRFGRPSPPHTRGLRKLRRAAFELSESVKRDASPVPRPGVEPESCGSEPHVFAFGLSRSGPAGNRTLSYRLRIERSTNELQVRCGGGEHRTRITPLKRRVSGLLSYATETSSLVTTFEFLSHDRVVPSGVEPASQWPDVYSVSRLPRTNPGTRNEESRRGFPGRLPRCSCEIPPSYMGFSRSWVTSKVEIP